MNEALLNITDLTVQYRLPDTEITSLDCIDITVDSDEIVGIVGESGSGKSTLASAIGGLLPGNASIVAGAISIGADQVVGATARVLRSIRRNRLGFISQNPISSLDPTRRVERSMRDVVPPKEDLADLLRSVGLHNVDQVLNSFPHQLSGGMAQRVAIAMALSRRPEVLIADEPTSALDADIRDSIMTLMVGMARDRGCALIIITHDLDVVTSHCHRVVVMRGGKIVEQGTVAQVTGNPQHEYTRNLLNARKIIHADEHAAPSNVVSVPGTAPAVSIENATVTYHSGPPWARVVKHAVRGVSLTINAGEMVGLVGSSGSGKTTISKLLLGLVRPASGRVLIDGRPLLSPRKGDPGRVQAVLQNPEWALNPFLKVRTSVAESLVVSKRVPRREIPARVDAFLSHVGLSAELGDRYPHQLSGGQRQRVAIARALIAGPRLVVFDEAVSALDVSIQAQILLLIRATQQEDGYAALFISHDPGAVAYIANRTIRVTDGQIAPPSAESISQGERDD